MARLPYVAPEQSSVRVRDALAALPDLNIFRMLAHAETAAEPAMLLSAALLTQLELDPKLRELAILTVAREAEAEYEWVQHVAIGQQVGLTDEQIAAVADAARAGALDDAGLAVVAFTTEVVRHPRASDEAFAVVNKHLTPRGIVELLLTIGNYLMLARLMTTLDLEVDSAVGNQTLAAARAPRGDSAL